MTTDETKTETPEGALSALGLTSSAVLIPTDYRGRIKEAQLNYRVTSSCAGRDFLVTDYHQGIGHIDTSKGPAMTYGKMSRDQAEAIYAICRGDLRHLPPGFRWRLPEWDNTGFYYCLVSDASVLDYSSFEEWASAFGYDTDSREAEKAYKACLEQSLKLTAVIGWGGLSWLQEAFQDY